jgi:hypothetical protein
MRNSLANKYAVAELADDSCGVGRIACPRNITDASRKISNIMPLAMQHRKYY